MLIEHLYEISIIFLSCGLHVLDHHSINNMTQRENGTLTNSS